MKFLLLTLVASLAAALPAAAEIQLRSSGPKANFLYENDPKALASSVQVVFRTGSLADPKGKEGLAKLAFNAMVRGTKELPKKEFFAAMEKLGASVSVDAGFNRTIVSLSTISENLEATTALLATAILTPALNDDDIKALVEERIAMLQQELASNRAVMRRAVRLALFRGTPLAFPSEGTLTGLKAIEPKDVKSFLAEQVKAGNVIFTVSSNRDEATVREILTKSFAALPKGDAPAAPALSFTAPEGRTLYVVERAGSSTTELGIGALGIKANHPDRLAIETGEYVLGDGGMSARFFDELRGKNGWTYGAYSSFSMMDLPRAYGGGYLIYAFPSAQFTEKLTLRALELYEDYVAKGVTKDELSYAKQSMTNSYPFKFASSRSRLGARLYSLLDGAPNYSVAEYKAKMRAIDLGRIKKAVQKQHNPKNVAIVVVGDPAQIEGLKKSIPGLKATVKIEDVMKPL